MTDKQETTEILTSFADLGLPNSILEAIATLGYTKPTPIQEQAIPALLAGSDVLGQAQTGTGKTAAFALPLLAQIDIRRREPQVLVLVPTRELALQVAEAFVGFSANMSGLNVLPIYGGQGYNTQLSMLRRGAHVIIGTPGRVMDHMDRGTLNLTSLKTLVLDEADEMLRMGFADDVETIVKECAQERQTALFSATMPRAIKTIADTYLKNPVMITVKSSATNNANIKQYFWQVSSLNKLDALSRILETEPTDAVIIFVRTKRATEELSEQLVMRGFNAVAINGDIVQKQRERVIEQLKTGRIKILVATDVAARGIDVDKITHVINYDPPHNAESYVHRIGRTGRAGRAGTAIIFISPRDKYVLRDIERVTKQIIEPMEAPSTKTINERRIAAFKQGITDAVAQDTNFYESLLQEYITETETPALKVAAALAKLMQGDKEFLLKKSDGQAKSSSSYDERRSSRSDSRSDFRSDSRSDRPRRARSDNDDFRGSRRSDSGDDFRNSRRRSESNDETRAPRSRTSSTEDFRDRYKDKFPSNDSGRRSSSRTETNVSVRSSRRPGGAETDMDQYRVDIGRDDGLQPKNLVGAIANTAGIEGRLIGKIIIENNYSTIDLPKGMPKDILQTLKKLKISGKQMNLEKVSK